MMADLEVQWENFYFENVENKNSYKLKLGLLSTDNWRRLTYMENPKWKI